MVRFPVRFLITVLVSVAWCDDFGAAAQNKPRPSREKQDAARTKAAAKDVKQAREKLQDGVSRLANARRDLADAEQEHRQRVTSTQQLRDQLQAKHESALKLGEAIRDQEAAQAAYDQLAMPVLDKLHQQPAYQSAVAAAEAARIQLRASPENNHAAKASQDEGVATLQRQLLRPRQLEQETLQAHPELESARAALDQARTKVAAIKKSVAEAVAADPALKSSTQALQQALQKVSQVKSQLAAEERAVGAAQQKLAKEQFDVQRAKSKDRANDKKKKR